MDRLEELKIVVDALDCKIATLDNLRASYVDEYNRIYRERVTAAARAKEAEATSQSVEEPKAAKAIKAK